MCGDTTPLCTSRLSQISALAKTRSSMEGACRALRTKVDACTGNDLSFLRAALDPITETCRSCELASETNRVVHQVAEMLLTFPTSQAMSSCTSVLVRTLKRSRQLSIYLVLPSAVEKVSHFASTVRQHHYTINQDGQLSIQLPDVPEAISCYATG